MNSNLNFEFGPVWYRPKLEPGRTDVRPGQTGPVPTGLVNPGEDTCSGQRPAAASPRLVEGDARRGSWQGEIRGRTGSPVRPGLIHGISSSRCRRGSILPAGCGRSPGGSRAPRRRCADGWLVGLAGRRSGGPVCSTAPQPCRVPAAPASCCEACQVASGSRGHRHRSPARDQCARVPMAITRACGVQRARLLRTCRDRAAIIRAGLGHGGVE